MNTVYIIILQTQGIHCKTQDQLLPKTSLVLLVGCSDVIKNLD